MRIREVQLNKFKRFTDLRITDLPASAKLVVLVGPNGCGKTSVFEAFNHFYKLKGYYAYGNQRFLNKSTNGEAMSDSVWNDAAPNKVILTLHDQQLSPTMIDHSIRGKFYFRTAFRNEPDFTISSMSAQEDPLSRFRIDSMNVTDSTVSNNYQKLISQSVEGLYLPENQNRLVGELSDEIVGIVRRALLRVFEDLTLSSLGKPLTDGSFFFTKGTSNNFHYSNLSAGEKAVLDLILDMVIQSVYYPDTVYCIDEPEAHMHTSVQGQVLKELYTLIPANSQLWIATHSFGMLKAAEAIERENPESVVFLDFGDRNFDEPVVIGPTKISRSIVNKFYELALGDYSSLVLPEVIVFCEGDPLSTKNQSFDRIVFSTIFENTYPNTQFISVGNANDVLNIESNSGDIMSQLLKNATVIKVIDGDDLSEQETTQHKQNGIRVLSRRQIESYLLDDEIIEELCISVNRQQDLEECLSAKKDAICRSVARKNPIDDIKSAAGEVYVSLKRILQLSKCGNSTYAFLRDTMAPLVTPDTKVYRQLEAEIFGKTDLS